MEDKRTSKTESLKKARELPVTNSTLNANTIKLFLSHLLLHASGHVLLIKHPLPVFLAHSNWDFSHQAFCSQHKSSNTGRVVDGIDGDLSWIQNPSFHQIAIFVSRGIPSPSMLYQETRSKHSKWR
jgi:hypothetical protein